MRRFAPDPDAIASMPAPAKPLAENSAVAAARMLARVRSGSRERITRTGSFATLGLATLPTDFLARAGGVLAEPLKRETAGVPAALVTPRLSIEVCSFCRPEPGLMHRFPTEASAKS